MRLGLTREATHQSGAVPDQHARDSSASSASPSGGRPRSTTSRTRLLDEIAERGFELGVAARRLADRPRGRAISRATVAASRSAGATCRTCATTTSSARRSPSRPTRPPRLRRRRGAGAAARAPRPPEAAAAARLRAQPRRARPPVGDHAPRVLHPRHRGGSGARAAELARLTRGAADRGPGLRARSLLRRVARHVPAQLPPRGAARGDARRARTRSPSGATACAATWRCCCSRRSSSGPGATALAARRLAAAGRAVLARRHRAHQAPPSGVRLRRRGLLGHGVGAAAGRLRLHLRQAALRSPGHRAPATPVREHLDGRARLPGPLAAVPREPRRAARGGDVRAADAHARRRSIALLRAGLRFFHDGQLEGRKVARLDAPRPPARRAAPTSSSRRSTSVCSRPCGGPRCTRASWRLWSCRPAWDGNPTAAQFVVASWERGDQRLLMVVNYGPNAGPVLRHAGRAGARGP